jgi:hypothetical protein
LNAKNTGRIKSSSSFIREARIAINKISRLILLGYHYTEMYTINHKSSKTLK